MKSIEDQLRVAAVSGLGRATYKRLVDYFGSWDRAANASVKELVSVPGIGSSLASAIRRSRELDVSAEISEARELGVRLVTQEDPAYPANLKLDDYSPLLLYMKGEVIESDRMAIAIVGARRCTYYGAAQAEKFAFGLARAGFCIISGLAAGIDTAAHRGALKAGGRTIAVIGSGLKRIYPPENRQLAEEILESGAVISELPLDTPPKMQNFPPRNRIIAGLSMGALVVEAQKRSGALITARLAMEGGKEVFAVPGQIDNPKSHGCHKLIQDGAKLVQSIEDVVEEFGPPAEIPGERTSKEVGGDSPASRLEGAEKLIYDSLDSTPKGVDEISEEVGSPTATILTSLLTLEMKGLVKQLPGKRYVRS